MRYWLMKSEADAFSIDDLARTKREPWDGVRNYQARNHMRAMAIGDRVLFYHSNANPSGVAGLATVCTTAYPDPTQFDPANAHFDGRSPIENPRWSLVDVKYVRTFAAVVPLATLRQHPLLSDMLLFRQSRLSVIPVEPQHYDIIVALADGTPRPAVPRSSGR